MEKLKADLKRQIIEALKLNHLKPEDIGDDVPLFMDGLGLDSIDALELIVLLQQHYGIRISDAQEGPKIFRTVQSMADYIQLHQKA